MKMSVGRHLHTGPLVLHELQSEWEDPDMPRKCYRPSAATPCSAQRHNVVRKSATGTSKPNFVKIVRLGPHRMHATLNAYFLSLKRNVKQWKCTSYFRTSGTLHEFPPTAILSVLFQPCDRVTVHRTCRSRAQLAPLLSSQSWLGSSNQRQASCLLLTEISSSVQAQQCTLHCWKCEVYPIKLNPQVGHQLPLHCVAVVSVSTLT
jgi:hypothetical protein